MLTRRLLLQLLAAGAIAPWPSMAMDEAEPGPVFGLWLLRGGVDGLTLLPPVGDPHYAPARGSLALERGEVTLLDALFGLHPSLPFLASAWQRGEVIAVQAVATPYRDRSHFDAQNVLETGLAGPGGHEGWLNRVIGVTPGLSAVAIGEGTPVVLRGPQAAQTWSTGGSPPVSEATLERVLALYAEDPRLGPAIAEARRMRAAVGGTGMPRRPGVGQGLAQAGAAAGRLIAAGRGPRVHVLDDNGWDTHARQGGGSGVLAQRLAALDAALDACRTAAGQAWRHTVIALVTEFGRTVAVNGTGGSDHGTAAAMVLVGGAVAGPRVLADWPGLDRRALYEGRDLRPTIDTRAILAGVLEQHLAVPGSALRETVFPGLAAHYQRHALVRGA